MQKRNKCIRVVKSKTKRSYNSYKAESDAEDAAIEDELVAMSVLENNGNEN
ncbi:MAG: hypothetical protein IKP05_00835 [Alphaproteobacteria bacterium]|nr:hypothetical protein [Alphaproteobacteria bacterium]